ncbi:RHS repeat-associated core domain-containing protein [Chryseobacterium shandongense]|uniref:RHS repeat-associated core domain-containing protein n=1 Tax=Chryseobacterium shandongense TaxID=1493872 RepID=UPI001E413082|nr:RHS repeat-associated core domain-containing protein [Chryseobacterium shandongense]
MIQFLGKITIHNNTAANFDNAYQYKYNGKELQETGMYDYDWRQYMPDIGRWNGMDQLTEKYRSTSPYG